ncbi:MAG: penicillin-binding protein 2 [Patescibacteria group bacterium]|nr:penicillin-binding protein 2 [Patescibacteria group bacterium]
MFRFSAVNAKTEKNNRVNFILTIIFLFNFLIVLKLFNLQIINGKFFVEASSNQHSIYQKITPKRGKIFLRNTNNELYPVAMNYELALIYSNSKIIIDAEKTAENLTKILKPLWLKEFEENINKEENNEENPPVGEDEEIIKEIKDEFVQKKYDGLKKKLENKNDPYEILAKKVPDKELNEILDLKEQGIGYVKENYRYYPEAEILGHITGFVGYEESEQKGQYGVEGYFDDLLRGNQGSVFSKKDAFGYLISTRESKIIPAQDGSDIVLTIDMAIQFKVCDELKKAVEKHSADKAMAIVINPHTGAIIAMCGVPGYDPNFYYKEKDLSVFNNPIIFDQYEPGSIFKAMTMSAGLDSGKVSPNTVYNDTGCVKIGVEKICNSDLKAYQNQTMTNVLEKSLNTGVIFVLNQVGNEMLKEYVENFGFGKPTGIELKPESIGNIKSLNKKKEIYWATASFGQGISVTPLQMVNAFSVIANNGKLMKPYIVEKIIDSNGIEQKTMPEEIRKVVSSRTAVLLSGMLASTVKKGHGKSAGVDGYYVAGKTGTAQVPKEEGGGYEEDKTIGSFVGFAPADNPCFTMLVRVDNPKDVIWAESSAAPLFGKIAKFILNYYQIEPEY